MIIGQRFTWSNGSSYEDNTSVVQIMRQSSGRQLTEK